VHQRSQLTDLGDARGKGIERAGVGHVAPDLFDGARQERVDRRRDRVAVDEHEHVRGAGEPLGAGQAHAAAGTGHNRATLHVRPPFERI
jgi:hypothetical protein